MGDPTTTTDRVKELTEITIQYLCQRELLELNDAINASWARQPTTAEELSIEMAIARRILERGLRPSARKPGRPPQRRNLHLQIAGAVTMLVEDFGLKPTRSHASRRRRDPSACSIVAAALEQRHEYLGDYLGECRGERLSERTVEDIWNKYRLSPLIFHQGATDYARTHRDRVDVRRRHLDSADRPE
jgi:hypothetical protein